MKLPDVSDLIVQRGAAHGLSLRSRRAALAQLNGGHRSAHRGRGLEFEEVRPYAMGDGMRTIDWHVTARRGKPHTKLFREERERPVWIVADLHPGLYFGSKRQFKSVVMLQAAALLGWMAVLGGDRVGAVIADGKGAPRICPTRNRESGILPVLQALVEGQPRAPGVSEQCDLEQALTMLRPVLQPGSLVLVLSDFGGLNQGVEEALAGITAQSDCRMLWIADPLERTGLPLGSHQVGLPLRQWWMDGDASRAAWQAVWRSREMRLNDLADRLNMPLLRLDTVDDTPLRLLELMKEQKWAT